MAWLEFTEVLTPMPMDENILENNVDREEVQGLSLNILQILKLVPCGKMSKKDIKPVGRRKNQGSKLLPRRKDS